MANYKHNKANVDKWLSEVPLIPNSMRGGEGDPPKPTITHSPPSQTGIYGDRKVVTNYEISQSPVKEEDDGVVDLKENKGIEEIKEDFVPQVDGKGRIWGKSRNKPHYGKKSISKRIQRLHNRHPL